MRRYYEKAYGGRHVGRNDCRCHRMEQRRHTKWVVRSSYGNRNLQHYPFQLLRSRFRSGKFQRCGCKSLYRKAVSFVAARGISTGTGNGNFSPQANLTRSMLVTILYRLENEPETNTSSLFRDVLPDLWYSDAVNWTSLS